MKQVSKIFRATLQRMRFPLKWVMVPHSVRCRESVGKTRAAQSERRKSTGFRIFARRFFLTARAGHRLLVNKEMQRGAKTAPGMSRNSVWNRTTWSGSSPFPWNSIAFCQKKKSLLRWFHELNHSTRTEICKWIVTAGSRTVRMRRAERMAERLLAAMEAEQDLPPTIQMALDAISWHAKAGT